MRVGVIKETGAKWLAAFYDHVHSNPDLVNGFKKAENIDALDSGVIFFSLHN